MNGDTLIDTLALDPLDVLIPATLTVSDIQITQDRVRWGQTDIRVNYTVQNNGQSDALFRTLVPHFWRDITEVSTEWVLSTIAPELPDTLTAGLSRTYNASYVLTSQATSGTVFPRPDLRYSDLHTQAFTDQFTSSINFDSVEVIQPAFVRVDSLRLIAPNSPRVNENQEFTLRFVVSNTGADTVASIYFSLLQDSLVVATFNRGNLAPFSTFNFDTTWSIASAAQYIYRFRIDSAFDVTTGSLVDVGESVDPVETIIVQTPANLQLVSAIISPVGAIDGTVSVGQTFNLRTTVTNSGEAAYDNGQLRLTVPANYQIIGGLTDRLFSPTGTATWQIRATALTTGAPDTLQLALIDSAMDVNTRENAPVNSFDQQVTVVTEPAAAANILLSITAPAGAVDSVVSTQQFFTVRADVNFINSIADTGRSAEILLPEGFAVATSSVKQLADSVSSGFVTWQLVAPDSATLLPAEIRVNTTARDGNSGGLFTSTSGPLAISVVTRPVVNIASARIIAPEGAVDGTVISRSDLYDRGSNNKTRYGWNYQW